MAKAPPAKEDKKDEAEAFFSQALDTVRAAPESEKSALMPLPERYKQALLDHVVRNFGSSLVFRSLNTANLPSGGQKFTDRSFPPERSSLIKFWDLADLQAQVEWANLTWQRISEVYSSLAVFDRIEPGDIRQGILGDCYFLSAISALAESPERVQRLFETKEVNPAGQYKVLMMDLGMWRTFVVDDFFPMSGHEEFAFSSPYMEKDVCEMWVLILEKAWAKKYDSYYDIQTGFADEVLTDLTGAPCRILQRTDPHLWQKLVEADLRNHIITAGCVGKADDPDNAQVLEGLGLVVDHSYAVISVRELNSDAGPVRLLQVRNPWRHFEWSGDWSDSSSKWTPALKKAVNFNKEQDGAFWMSLSDFVTYFETCTICMVEDTYWTESLPMDQTKEEEFSVVEVRVTETSDLFVIACQVDERRFGGIEGGYSYSPVRMLAAKETSPTSLSYITGKVNSSTRDSWLQLKGLTPGIYLIYIEFLWKSTATDLFGVSVYSDHSVNLRDVTAPNTNYMQKCFNPASIVNFAPKPVMDSGDFHYYTVALAGKEGHEPNLYLDWFENTSKTAQITVEIRHQPWVNMQFIGEKDSLTGEMTVVLEPGEGRVVGKKQKRMDSKHSFKVSLKKSYGESGKK